jgi:hypothetical protein
VRFRRCREIWPECGRKPTFASGDHRDHRTEEEIECHVSARRVIMENGGGCARQSGIRSTKSSTSAPCGIALDTWIVSSTRCGRLRERRGGAGQRGIILPHGSEHRNGA